MRRDRTFRRIPGGVSPRARPLFPLVVLLSIATLFLGGCEETEDLERPVPLYGEEPIEYPLTLWDQGVEGETVLRVRVTEVGMVDSVEVVHSSGHQGLDAAAVLGVRDLRFEPGRRNGKRVPMWATLPVQFSKRPQSNDRE